MNEILGTALVTLTTVLAAPAAQSSESLTVRAAVPRLESMTQARRDAWLGADKFRHFWMSYAATAAGFTMARAAEQDTETALAVGIGVAALAGIGKEIHDRRRGWLFSVRDLVADALGISAAYFLLREVR